MRPADLRTDNNQYSEWSHVTQCLRRGFVLSPFVINGFVAAALHVVVVGFSKNEAILRDFGFTHRCWSIKNKLWSRWHACEGLRELLDTDFL